MERNEIDDDEPDDWYDQEIGEVCDCGEPAIDSCGFCGKPLCGMCSECGAGFCSGPHTKEQIAEYDRQIHGGR